jgi:uncharacterized protein YdaU (DUF1376 family)
MNYYPHHIGDYLKDTAHLTMVEDGAYRRLIDLYYLHEQPLPAERTKVYRLARAISAAEKEAVDTILDEYFSLAEDGWRHKRCDEELAKSQEKSQKARTSAAKRWKSEGNANGHANADADAMRTQMPLDMPSHMPTHSEGNAYPITNNQEPIKEKHSSAAADQMPAGFNEFWRTWPNTQRKAAKSECLKRWKVRGLERVAPQITAHVAAMKTSKQWQDGFEPAPLTYLNQRRWEDGLPADGGNTDQYGVPI